MHLESEFTVKRSREDAVEILARDDTLPALFPEAKTEIIERRGDRRTLRAQYRALGQEGVATFHFDFLPEGDVRFEKVCDGRVWRELAGSVSLRRHGKGTRVCLELDGRTKSLIPEFTIRGPMQNQIEQMASALLDLLEL